MGRWSLKCLAALVATTLALTGCEFGKTTIGLGVPAVVVHAVLNPLAPVEEILVEQTLTGATLVDTSFGYNPSDPIASGGGIPITGATVIISAANGDSVVAQEGFGNGGGEGVYVIANSLVNNGSSSIGGGLPSFAFAAGEQYRLRIVTRDGNVVTGSTRIPAMPAQFDSVSQALQFDRTRDTLSLAWPSMRGARSYLVQVSTPFNTYETLVDTLGYRIPGSARNTQARTVPHMFIPGFMQLAIVGAVDSNYYDYERFRSDVSVTETRVNHLVGGIGVFGAYVPLVFRQIAVTAPFTLPIEGVYNGDVGNAPDLPSQFQLYIESPAGDNGLAQVSGSYVRPNGDTGGLIGVFDGSRVTIAVLVGDAVLDTAAVIDGVVRPDSIIGVVRRDGSTITYTKGTPPG